MDDAMAVFDAGRAAPVQALIERLMRTALDLLD